MVPVSSLLLKSIDCTTDKLHNIAHELIANSHEQRIKMNNMRAGWPLFNAGMSKLLLAYLCQDLATAETLLLHQSDRQASSCE